MKNLTKFIVTTIVLVVLLSFGPNVSVNATNTPRAFTGEITMIGQDTLKIREDETGVEYELKASPERLKKIVAGYRAEVTTNKDGRISSLTVVGIPMQAEPQPFQKWTVIKYPGGQPSYIIPQGVPQNKNSY